VGLRLKTFDVGLDKWVSYLFRLIGPLMVICQCVTVYKRSWVGMVKECRSDRLGLDKWVSYLFRLIGPLMVICQCVTVYKRSWVGMVKACTWPQIPAPLSPLP